MSLKDKIDSPIFKIVVSIIGIMSVIYGLLQGFGGINADIIERFLPKLGFHVYWWMIIILSVLCLSLFVGILVSLKQDSIPLVNDSVKQKHPILVIDDEKTYLKKAVAKIKEQGYDAVVGINNLVDSRLVDAFEIIVSDINGIGSLKEAKDLLEAIHKKYPYKIIIPISTDSYKIHVGEQLIIKDGAELSEIIKKINAKIDLINNTELFWKSVEYMCEEWKMSKNEIEKRKKAFIHYLNGLNGGWV